MNTNSEYSVPHDNTYVLVAGERTPT